MNLTAEQQAVVSLRLKPGETAKCIAYAGTGKTSTCVAYTEQDDTPALYLAFNKSVEVEAKSKFPSHVKSSTVHALAWRQEGRNYDGFGNIRYFDVMKKLRLNVYGATLVCQTLENWLNSAEEVMGKRHAADDFKKQYGAVDYKSDLVRSARVIFECMRRQEKPFMMTHSGYLKLYQLSKPRIPQRLLLLDEAQDTNPVTFDIVLRQLEHGARILLTGDPYQQIYSWRGAVDAMRYTDCVTKYLTQSFRFGSQVAGVANDILSTFFGEKIPVRGSDHVKDALVTSFPATEQYTIITRTNVALFSNALTLAMSGKKVHAVGEDAFLAYLDGILQVYYVSIGARDSITDRSLLFFHSYDQLKQFAIDRDDRDLLSKISIVDKYKKNLLANVDRVKSALVPAQYAQVILVTCHKAKGLEWNNVELADDFSEVIDETSGQLVRIKEIVEADTTITPEQKAVRLKGAIPRDEINLLYVAATRAKRCLKLNHQLRYLKTLTEPGSASTPPPPPPQKKSFASSGTVRGPARVSDLLRLPDDMEEAQNGDFMTIGDTQG